MKKVIIFGVGKSSELVQKCLLNNEVKVVGYCDNDSNKQGVLYNNLPIMAPDVLSHYDFDYMIVATFHYTDVYDQLINLNINDSMIILFFAADYIGNGRYKDIFEFELWHYCTLSQRFNIELDKLNNKVKTLFNNIDYEVAYKMKSDCYKFPIIKSASDTIIKIIEEKCSISRFGDGEFELIEGRPRPKYQSPNPTLARRLQEILKSNLEKHIVAIADNYGALDLYEEDAAMGIRSYLTPSIREDHMRRLDLNKEYFDAYLSRPYIIYKNKEEAFQKFNLIKKIWDKREVVIIEGDKTRMGIGNDLFSNAASVRRILAPSINAFDQYDQILQEALKQKKDVLFLLALGPTATVLAYDLALAGYQAVDIGHIDLEYDWFRSKAKQRMDNKYKYVNEIPNGDKVLDIDDPEYIAQIIKRINNIEIF
jgi:glycosyltransferase family protein